METPPSTGPRSWKDGNRRSNSTQASLTSLMLGQLASVRPFSILTHSNVLIYIALDRVLYTPEHVGKIAVEAAKPAGASAFSLDDRIGLVHDAMALSKAGLAKLSSALTLVDALKGETECMCRGLFPQKILPLFTVQIPSDLI